MTNTHCWGLPVVEGGHGPAHWPPPTAVSKAHPGVRVAVGVAVGGTGVGVVVGDGV
jgi:hypothetical protein